jgi:hypothetical protein
MKTPTSRGGFSLQNGIGKLLGRSVGPLSKQQVYQIRISVQHQKKKSLVSYQQAGHGLDRQATGTQKSVSPDGQVGESAEE